MDTIEPSKIDSIDHNKIVPSQMFTITKLGPHLTFVKIKAILVAGGHRETMDPDPDIFTNSENRDNPVQFKYICYERHGH